MDEPLKRAVAVVIEQPGSGRWLLVRRPPDDEDLPDVWGLPAGTAGPEETVEALVARIGRDKLGVSLGLGRRLARGHRLRPRYRLEMELWSAALEDGSPVVPQPVTGVTQYRDWRWAAPSALEEGARAGSLCCRLGAEYAGRSRSGG